MGRAARAKRVGEVPKALYDEPQATRRRIFRELREVGENVPDTLRYCTGCHKIPAHCACGHDWRGNKTGPEVELVTEHPDHSCLYQKDCPVLVTRYVPRAS